MRTLVIHIGALGDFLLSCPVLEALRQDGPVELLGARSRLDVAVEGGLADRAHDADGLDFYTLFSTPSPRLAGFLGGFDRCVAWMRPDAILSGNLFSCGIGDVRAFPGLPPAAWGRHASEYYAGCLDIEDPGPPRLRFETAGTAGLDVVIHPGSGGARKNWALKNFETVAGELTRHGRRVWWCKGPAEENLAPPDPVLPAMTPSALARSLASANLYIGNDSGVTHLAAAAGCRVVAVFGPTDPAVWAPRGANVRVARGKDGSFPELREMLAQIPS